MANVHRICTDTRSTGHVSLVKTANICMKKIHVSHFFADKRPYLASWFETSMFNKKNGTKHWKQRNVGACFVIWNKKNNFLLLKWRVVRVKNMFHASANLRELKTCAKIRKKTWKQCISCIFWMINAHVWQINLRNPCSTQKNGTKTLETKNCWTMFCHLKQK